MPKYATKTNVTRRQLSEQYGVVLGYYKQGSDLDAREEDPMEIAELASRIEKGARALRIIAVALEVGACEIMVADTHVIELRSDKETRDYLAELDVIEEN